MKQKLNLEKYDRASLSLQIYPKILDPLCSIGFYILNRVGANFPVSNPQTV